MKDCYTAKDFENLSDSPITVWAFIKAYFPEVTDDNAVKAAHSIVDTPDPLGLVKRARTVQDIPFLVG